MKSSASELGLTNRLLIKCFVGSLLARFVFTKSTYIFALFLCFRAQITKEKESYEREYHFQFIHSVLQLVTTHLSGILELSNNTAFALISYPQSSGFLVSGWAPGETLGNSKKINFFGWLPRNDFHCFTAKNLAVTEISVPQSLLAPTR